MGFGQLAALESNGTTKHTIDGCRFFGFLFLHKVRKPLTTQPFRLSAHLTKILVKKVETVETFGSKGLTRYWEPQPVTFPEAPPLAHFPCPRAESQVPSFLMPWLLPIMLPKNQGCSVLAGTGACAYDSVGASLRRVSGLRTWIWGLGDNIEEGFQNFGV